MKPAGRYVMADLDRYGGVALVMKRLLEGGLLHADTMTVTGKTLQDNVAAAETIDEQPIIHRVDSPRSPTGGLAILYGNLAPEGAVIKVAGHQERVYQGPARVFDQEEAAFQTIQRREIKPGDIVVIRYEGPKGGPGMREMLAVTSALVGQGLGDEVALITGRSFFRRQPRPHGRARDPGSCGGRTHWSTSGRRHHHPGHPRPPVGCKAHRRGNH